MKKRMLSILCVLALCLTLLPVAGLAADPEGMWTDHAADSFAGGDGTEGDPYQIAAAEQLAKLSKDVSEGKLVRQQLVYFDRRSRPERALLASHWPVQMGRFRYDVQQTL